MNTKYNESNLETLFNGIHEKLDKIFVQTEKTNGRVLALERWRSYVAGAMAVIILICIPLVLQYVGVVLAR